MLLIVTWLFVLPFNIFTDTFKDFKIVEIFSNTITIEVIENAISAIPTLLQKLHTNQDNLLII